jgi:predicted Zn-dependent peptidase
LKLRCIGWAIALLLSTAAIPCDAVSPAAPADAVLRATLPNGMRVVIVPDRLAPVVTTELNYKVGSNDAPDGFPGTAHALEHMMFRGSDGLDKDQLAELGALLGGVYNADTTETVTQFTYTVPSDNLDIALRIEALRMRGLSLNQADWDKERGAIEQEVARDLSSPFYTFMAQAQAILFDQTPYQHDALGTRASFDRTDAALLRAFYERWYAPNNAILVIAGDVQPEDALVRVQQAFADIPSRDLPAHKPITTSPVQPRTLALETNFPAGLVALTYRMPGLNQRDFAAADILSDVIGSERGALYKLVPDGKALMTQFSYQPKEDVGFGLALAAFPTGGDPAPLLAELRQIIAAGTGGGFEAAGTRATRIPQQQHKRAGRNLVAGARLPGCRVPRRRPPRLRGGHRRGRQSSGAPAARPGPCRHRDPHAARLGAPGGRNRLRRCRVVRQSAGASGDAAGLGRRRAGDPACAGPGRPARCQRAAERAASDRPAGACQPHRQRVRPCSPGRLDAGAAGAGGGQPADARAVRLRNHVARPDRLPRRSGSNRRTDQRRPKLLAAGADAGVRGGYAAAGGKRAAARLPR